MDRLLDEYLMVDPLIHHGKPCFRGTRIPVYIVLELLEGGVKSEEIVGENYYPELTLEHIRAALHFAAEYAKNQEYTLFQKSI
ncbi:MAG: DUF433 domain-containing protein [Chlamydiae bacterium]|nr:DUF433 domain-containing protein [Chlamydiota bacterium]MBI3278104.1 DUF433 domain-containing protein [Chlamydiota bacterium]